MNYTIEENMNTTMNPNLGIIRNVLSQLSTLFTSQSPINDSVTPILEDDTDKETPIAIDIEESQYVEPMELHEFVERYSYTIDLYDYSFTNTMTSPHVEWKLLQHDLQGSDYFYDIESNQIMKN